jgi:hypothetical protein
MKWLSGREFRSAFETNFFPSHNFEGQHVGEQPRHLPTHGKPTFRMSVRPYLSIRGHWQRGDVSTFRDSDSRYTFDRSWLNPSISFIRAPTPEKNRRLEVLAIFVLKTSSDTAEISRWVSKARAPAA